ncbi:type A chloramphenicol O-acetyltransferase [Paenalkalicoccus suaedae]|uniref:Chloramphenicol acetyltransferase n=1 Tax=Paenalkalicoccus suaedae TaxID=2592382 RepID=A0A859FIC0_9BACI|nr:type A chloramphenicol O-acetyltransferase [Paenalkalicoccus suaedae]QKS72819.1 type A chloramphenicol O-acetyltransferase [Paenalkalicoccus suaedae]
MTFIRINKKEWDRKEYFDHYLNQQTTFSMTSNIDITKLLVELKKRHLKIYPAFIYLVSKVANSHKEFRMAMDSNGEVGYWGEVYPSYTIFDQEAHTFSSIWTKGLHDFALFHSSYEKDVDLYKNTGKLFPKTPVPENTIPISMIPWSSFTGFHLSVNNGGNYLSPIITSGKFSQLNGRTILPVSVQVHHAVCDGYHASLFINELQLLADSCENWI